MTVSAFNLPAVLPGAPPSPGGADVAASSAAAGVFADLLAGQVEAGQGGWSASAGSIDKDADAISGMASADGNPPVADASMAALLFSPMPPPTPTVAPPPIDDPAVTAESLPGAAARGVDAWPVAASPTASLAIDAGADVAETPFSPTRLADPAGLREPQIAVAPAPAPAVPPTVLAQTTAPAVAAAVGSANDMGAAETMIAAATVAPKAGPTEGDIRRAATSARGDRRDSAAGQSVGPFAPKGETVTASDFTDPGTVDQADAGAAAPTEPAMVDADEAPDQGQPSATADTRVQGGMATAPLADAAAVRGSPETVARMAADIIRKLEGQSTRFDLELAPHGLGKVDVAIEIDRAGRLTAAMSFDSAQSASDLRGRAGELRLALEQAGFDIAEGGLTFDLAGQGAGLGGREAGQQERAWNGRAFQRAQSGADDADLSLAAAPATPTRWTRSGVDIRI